VLTFDMEAWFPDEPGEPVFIPFYDDAYAAQIPSFTADLDSVRQPDEWYIQEDYDGNPLGPANGFIYYVICPISGLIKIGFAKDVADRMGKLATATPYGLQLLTHHAGGKRYEKEIQTLFAELRVNREWFWPHAKLCEWIFFRADDGCR
jgi:hypothetical protein